VYRDIVTFIMEHCPQAWVINYTNPMAVCTGALFRAAPQIHAFGCCHEVFGTQKMLAKKVSEWFDVPEPPREEIALDIAGVNHFTFATEVSWQGEDLLPRLLEMVADDGFFRDRTAEARRAKEQGLWFDHAGLIAYDFLRRFGALGAAGDRHLAEFVSWYLCDEASLHRWGTLATPYTWRLERSRCARPTLAEVAREGLKPSGEEGVQQIEALLGLRPLTTNINLPNVGQIADLPKQAVVETYAEIGRGHIRPLVARPLPPALLAIEARIARQQLLLLEAAWEGDTDLAFQVLLADPLVNIPTDRAWRMFQEMLAAIRYPRSRHG
jgi:alpha-galactosidase